jgi:hypothetical protein
MSQPRKTGRPRIEDRAQTIEAKKPWLKLQMSRRTWYRRQAESVKAGSDPGLSGPLSPLRRLDRIASETNSLTRIVESPQAQLSARRH